jgi:23S rRNA pseudouridine2605 synthase
MTTLKGSGKKTVSTTRKKGPKNISDSIIKTSKRKTVKKIKQDKIKHHASGEKDQIRLNRYIASTGLCSRRKADEYIKSGLVTVNNKVISELGTRIFQNDVVKFNGERIREEKRIYILLNKPKDYITTVEDPHASKTVLDLVKHACKERVYPVGRLDRTTTGVLLITNDGDLTRRLTHPKFNKLKVYQVTLNKGLKPADLEKISKGVTLEDGFIKADSISYVSPADKKQVGIEIHSGRNRIVRRIFEHMNYRILKLDRVYFAGLTKKGLGRGQWRFLTDREISMLKMSAYK